MHDCFVLGYVVFSLSSDALSIDGKTSTMDFAKSTTPPSYKEASSYSSSKYSPFYTPASSGILKQTTEQTMPLTSTQNLSHFNATKEVTTNFPSTPTKESLPKTTTHKSSTTSNRYIADKTSERSVFTSASSETSSALSSTSLTTNDPALSSAETFNITPQVTEETFTVFSEKQSLSSTQYTKSSFTKPTSTDEYVNYTSKPHTSSFPYATRPTLIVTSSNNSSSLSAAAVITPQVALSSIKSTNPVTSVPNTPDVSAVTGSFVTPSSNNQYFNTQDTSTLKTSTVIVGSGDSKFTITNTNLLSSNTVSTVASNSSELPFMTFNSFASTHQKSATVASTVAETVSSSSIHSTPNNSVSTTLPLNTTTIAGQNTVYPTTVSIDTSAASLETVTGIQPVPATSSPSPVIGNFNLTVGPSMQILTTVSSRVLNTKNDTSTVVTEKRNLFTNPIETSSPSSSSHSTAASSSTTQDTDPVTRSITLTNSIASITQNITTLSSDFLTSNSLITGTNLSDSTQMPGAESNTSLHLNISVPILTTRNSDSHTTSSAMPVVQEMTGSSSITESIGKFTSSTRFQPPTSINFQTAAPNASESAVLLVTESSQASSTQQTPSGHMVETTHATESPNSVAGISIPLTITPSLTPLESSTRNRFTNVSVSSSQINFFTERTLSSSSNLTVNTNEMSTAGVTGTAIYNSSQVSSTWSVSSEPTNDRSTVTSSEFNSATVSTILSTDENPNVRIGNNRDETTMTSNDFTTQMPTTASISSRSVIGVRTQPSFGGRILVGRKPTDTAKTDGTAITFTSKINSTTASMVTSETTSSQGWSNSILNWIFVCLCAMKLGYFACLSSYCY